MTLIFNNVEFNKILDNIKINNKTSCDNICSICREPLLLDTIILNCKHRYHSTCIKNSFYKYESKKCPLCQEMIFWDSYKTQCMTKKKDGNLCNKSCYNDEKMCNLHINSHLRMLEKERNKENITKRKNHKKNLKKIKIKKNQLDKLKEKVKILENEIKLLDNEISL
jgi:hypothetical protein